MKTHLNPLDIYLDLHKLFTLTDTSPLKMRNFIKHQHPCIILGIMYKWGI